MSKKLRIDAAEGRLTAEQRDELARLVAANCSLEDLMRTFARWGQPIALSTASRTAARLRQAGDRLLKNREAVRAWREAAARDGITLPQAALDQAALTLTDVLDAAGDPTAPEAQQLLLAALPALTGVRNAEIAADRVRAGREALALAERRVKLLEANQAKAGAVIADDRLSPAERERKLKDIFGIA